jgi:DNA-binding NtrC family response regulator
VEFVFGDQIAYGLRASSTLRDRCMRNRNSLNVFPLRIPPLRERPEDIPVLVRHFAAEFSRRMSKTIETIPSQTMKAVCEYRWPGNIRESQNVIERAIILSPGNELERSCR